jgi:predicted ATP-dependent endonuclease of OLD family
MRLLKVRVRDFRCVDDSNEFSVNQVTCLVGKNESGKTTILKALHKLRPESSNGEKFEPARDYPRRKWRPGVEVPKTPAAIATDWEFSDTEWMVLEKRFGKGAITDRVVRLTKGYDNVRTYRIGYNEAVLVKNLISGARFNATEKKPLSDVQDIGTLTKRLANVASRSAAQEQLYKDLQTYYPKDAITTIVDAVDAFIPTFLYFDQYLRLPGAVSVDALTRRKKSNDLTDDDQIFLALLALAGTTLEKLHSTPKFEEFNAALRAVSNQISDQIFKYWTQNRHLDVEMRLDQARPEDEAPFNSGYVFRTRINNKRHRADTSFDDRSSGFVWFFSFLVWFTRLRETHKKNLVILLDEPGLTLHARAQADLLRYMNEQLRPDYQVLYTTHSPFMIDPDDLLAARTVEDMVTIDRKTGHENLLGTKVSEEVLSTDPDTISPLQRALDYEMTQTLFIGRHTVLVEGPSDFLYLKWFSKQLERRGKQGLDYRWNVSIVGGIDRIPGFVSLFRGNSLHIAALVDVHHGDKQKLENARKALQDRHLLTNDTYAETKEADIEDVLGREFYVALVNKAYGLSSTTAALVAEKLRPSGSVVKEVEAAFAVMPQWVRHFDHFEPSEFLFQNEDDGAAYPGFEDTLNRFHKLIDDLNALLPRNP